MGKPAEHKRGDPVWKGTDSKGRDVWQLAIRFPKDAAGKYPTRRYNVHGTLTDARRRQRDLERDRDQGELTKAKPGTVAAYLDEWQRGLSHENLSPHWVVCIRGSIKHHIAPGLGHHRLDQLTATHVEDYITARLAEGASIQSITHERNHLRKALRLAVARGTIRRNVASDARWRNPTRQKPPKSISEEDTRTMLKGISDPNVYALAYLAVTTGMRRSELAALRWASIDLKGANLTINESLFKDDDAVWKSGPCKSGSGTITINAETVAVLKQQRKRCAAAQVRFGDRWKARDLVFPWMELGRGCVPGDYWNPSTMGKAFRAEIEGAFPDLTLHCLRHSHGTHLIRAGVPVKFVSERLRHKSPAFTMKQYIDVLPDSSRATAEAIPHF